MKVGNFRRRVRQTDQDGYILLTIILFAVIMMIAMMADAHHIANGIRHDREEELVHRGAQYARAIKKYFKKFGSYPVRIEQLEDTNHLRFLRKRYKDPITGQDFKPLRLGEIQLPAMGSGTGIAGATSAAALASQSSAFGRSSSGQLTGPGASSTIQPQPMATTAQTFGSGTGQTFGAGIGQTFGGGPMIGVASTSKKQSMKEFNQKDHYNDWWFIYDPTTDRGTALINGPYNGPPKFGTGTIPGAAPIGAPVGGPASSFGNPSSFGQPSSPFGGAMQPVPKPTPQQQ